MRSDTQQIRLDLFGIFSLAALFFSVTRGFVPLTFGSSELSRPTYTFSFILCLLMSLQGLRLALCSKNAGIPKSLRLLLVANLVLNVIWWVPIVALNPERALIISLAYTGLFPFSILAFARVPERRLTAVLLALTFIVAASVLWDFIELNTGLVRNGYDLTVARQTLLRPETFVALGRTGNLMRPVGILGGDRPHDTGNLLALFCAHWVALLFRKRATKVAMGGASAVAISAMLMTQSASNIAAFFVGLLFILVAHRKRLFSLNGITIVCIGVATGALLLCAMAYYFGINPGMLWRWSERIGPGGDWRNMTALGITDPKMDFFIALVGHGSSLGLSRIGDVTELGFVKMLMESGLIYFALFSALLTYPAWSYFRSKDPEKHSLLPYVAPVVVGFVSLWHYGSVLRTTNIFVFFALYAHALPISAGGARGPENPGFSSRSHPN